MLSTRHMLLPLLATWLASGCVTQSVTVAGPGAAGTSTTTEVGAPPLITTAARARTQIVGRVLAPEGMVAAGGGNVVGNNGGTMVAAGGLNFGLLATPEDPLANAWVRLADSAGQVFPAIAAVQADALGQFSIQDIPTDLTFVVQSAVTTAEGKTAQLQTIVRPTVLGATAELSAASTCVTAAVLDGQEAMLGDVDPARFKRAVDATRAGLDGKPWPDLADRGAVLAVMRDLARDVAELRDALNAVKTDLKKLQGDVSQIRAELDELKRRQAASPSPMPAPPAAITTPAASATPAPTTSPVETEPTPAPSPSSNLVTLDGVRFPLPRGFAQGPLGFALQPGTQLLASYSNGGEIANNGLRIGILALDGNANAERDTAFWEGPTPPTYTNDRFIKQIFKPAVSRFISANDVGTQYLSGIKGEIANYQIEDVAGAQRTLAVIDAVTEDAEGYILKHYMVFMYGSAERLPKLLDVRNAFEDMVVLFEIKGTKRYP